MNWLLLEVSIVLILAVVIVISTLPKKRKNIASPPPTAVPDTPNAASAPAAQSPNHVDQAKS